MKKNEVQVGAVYLVKVSGKVQPVRVVRESSFGGWEGINVNTGREVRIKTAAKLRRLYVPAPSEVIHESDRFYGDGRDSDFETDA